MERNLTASIVQDAICTFNASLGLGQQPLDVVSQDLAWA